MCSSGCCSGFSSRALVTARWQRDKELPLTGVTNNSHRGFKRRFSWVFEGIPHISDLGLEGAIRAKV
jgi:hypothetical protein